jgi:anaerobic selenocysteine-containing dehydrogenase
VKKLPLFVSVDPFINETSALADYIVPDTVTYESWGIGAPWADVVAKSSTVRWPTVDAATLRLTVANAAERPEMPAATTRVFAVRAVAAASPTVRTAAPRFLTPAGEAFWLLTAA